MQPRFLSALFFLTFLLASPLALPFQRAGELAAAPPPQDQAIHIGVPLVNVYASVLDKHNVFVPNLEQSDFKIFEDKVEQKIAFFSHEKTLPLSIGLLIDTSGSEKNSIHAEQLAASKFLHRILQAGDKAFVVAFDVDAHLLTNWTNDLETLDRAIDRAEIGAGGANKIVPGQSYGYLGGTHLYDTVYAAAVKKMAGETARKALIILTDATDEGSFVTIQQAVEAAQRADTLVQVLVVYNKKDSADFGSAKKLAQETGGRAIDIVKPDKLQKAFDQISAELRTEYSLGYYPTKTDADGKYRQLKVVLRDKSCKVLTRKGYYPRAAGK